MERNNIIKFPIPWYKNINIVRIALVISLFLIMLVIGSLTVHAEESTYSYQINFKYSALFDDSSKNNSGSYYYNVNTSDYPVACRYDDNGYIYILSYNGSKVYNIHPACTDFVESGNRDYSPSKYNNGATVDSFDSSSTFSIYGATSLTCSFSTDIPLFASGTDLTNYFLTGDTSGQLNKPTIDYSKIHNFANDIVDSSVPLPEISNVSHSGFTVDNISDYYIDVIVNTNLYGVKLDKNTVTNNKTNYDCVPDTSWVYANHYYNIADHTDMALNKSVINIKDDYGIDTIANLISDFEAWSIEYPTYKLLPTYTWTLLNGQIEKLYKASHVIDSTSGISLEKQLYNSGQAETTYYIRFYTNDNKTGQWVRYVYRDGYDSYEEALNTGNAVISGSVEVDSSGNVHIKDEIQGIVDDSGNITYPIYGNDSGIGTDVTLNGFKDTLEEFVLAVGNMPEYISKLFGFLPWWCTALIGLAIGAVVILRFLGR